MTIEPTRPSGASSKLPPSRPEIADKVAVASQQATEPQDQFRQMVRVKVFPQDPMVGPTEQIELPKDILGDRLSSPRLRTRDSAPIAIADPDGNYDFEVGTPEFDQANAHATVASTLFMYDGYFGKQADFSFPGPLNIFPHQGVGKTAYFSRMRRSINFFGWDSPSLGKWVTTSQAADVIAHEIGHAVWDGLRPRAGYSNEAGAFHEAFGDCSALLHALQHDSNIVTALEQNGGDLRKPSLISRMAEEFGVGFNKEDRDPNNDDRMYYRTALNEFKYIDPKKLPDDDYPPTVGEDVLTREFHSFSRVWSGAFYRMLTAVYDGNRAEGQEPADALKSATSTLGHTWGKALLELPPTGITFRVVGQSMLRQANRDQDKTTFDQLAGVLLDRDILTQGEVDAIKNETLPKVQLDDQSPGAVLKSMSSALELPEGFQSEGEPQKLKDGRTIYLFTRPERHQLRGLSHQGDSLEVELRSGLSATFDESGKLVSYFHTPIGDAEREDADVFAQDLLAKDRIQEEPISSVEENDRGRVFLGRLLPDRQGVKLLERLPIFD